MNDLMKKGLFNPKDLKTLRPECVPFVGEEYSWEFLYVQDSGQYEGQGVYYAYGPNGERDIIGGWVPEEDIAFKNEAFVNNDD